MRLSLQQRSAGPVTWKTVLNPYRFPTGMGLNAARNETHDPPFHTIDGRPDLPANLHELEGVRDGTFNVVPTRYGERLALPGGKTIHTRVRVSETGKTKPTPKAMYSKRIASEILNRVAMGWTINRIRKEKPEFEPYDGYVVMTWLRENLDGFYDRWLDAKRVAAEALADEIMDIADDDGSDYVQRQTRNGTQVVGNQELVQRTRIRIETRRYLMGANNPKRFSERITNQAADAEGNSVAMPAITLSAMVPTTPDGIPTTPVTDTRTGRLGPVALVTGPATPAAAHPPPAGS